MTAELWDVTFPVNFMNQPYYQRGEVYVFSHDGDLVDSRAPGTDLLGPSATAGGLAYDPDTDWFWTANLFGLSTHDYGHVSAFDKDTLETTFFTEVSEREVESVLVRGDFIYVGIQQRDFGQIGVVDDDWKSMWKMDKQGNIVQEIGSNQFGHHQTDWLDFTCGLIIYTDEKRLIRTLNVETGEEAVWADVFGTGGSGRRFTFESTSIEQTYEQQPGPDSVYGIQVSRANNRVYVMCRGWVQPFTPPADVRTHWVGVWDLCGNHIENWTLGAYCYDAKLTPDEKTLWATQYESAEHRHYRIDSRTGEGSESPFIVFTPDNQQWVGGLGTLRDYFVPAKVISGRPLDRRLRFRRRRWT